MDEVVINTSKTVTLSLGSDPTDQSVSATLVHEWSGDTVKASTTCTRTGVGTYTITYGENESGSGTYYLESGGIHKVTFSYTVNGTAYTSDSYFIVYSPYISSSNFFAIHSGLSASFSSSFSTYEKKVRRIINTYCGQDFYNYTSKSITLDGNDSRSLHLPKPLYTLTTVYSDYGDSDQLLIHDSSDSTKLNLEKTRSFSPFESSWHLRFKNKITTKVNERLLGNTFKSKSDYRVTGDWGWQSVPNNVESASEILIADMMNNDSEYRNHRIISVDMDAARISFDGDFLGTTGNTEADILLMDYTTYVMDYVG
tara:strand:+ start:1234 stop:2169 length:936 start_codon:yes stop_codon:yes gene_type:complete